MTDIKELHIRYIQVSDFRKRMANKFPNLSIAILSRTLLFDGHASEIEAAKVELNTLIDSLSVHIDNNIAQHEVEVI